MLGKEPVFGINEFNEAKYLNETETVATGILNLLFGKPGFFPSMPNLGLDIPQIIYSFWDEIDPIVLKAQIVTQCKSFKQFADDGSLDIIKAKYKSKPLLLIVIPMIIKDKKEHLTIGITQDTNGNTSYNYTFEDNS